MPLAKSISSVLVYAAALIAILCVILLTTAKITRLQPLLITSGSMLPVYDVGDAVIISRGVAASDIRVGDVITYAVANGTVVTHRVDRVFNRPEGLFWRTYGDANEAADPNLVPSNQLKGRVVGRLPLSGLLVPLYQNEYFKSLLFCIPLVILFGATFAKHARYALTRVLSSSKVHVGQ